VSKNEAIKRVEADFAIAMEIAKRLELYSSDVCSEDILKILRIVAANFSFEVSRVER